MNLPTLDDVRAALQSEWGLRDCRLTPVTLAMNSRTWRVVTAGGEFVAKLVDERDGITPGLAAAAHLADHGVRSGRPVRSIRNEMVVRVNEGWLALLRYEDGRMLRVEDRPDRRLWGDALGRCHAVLATFEPPDTIDHWPWMWLTADRPHLDLEPWIRPAVLAASERATTFVDRCRPQQGFLHADPNPQEFLVNDAGDVAIVDWGDARWGPFLYDLGSVLFFSDGERRRLDAFLEGYRPHVEMDGSLEEGLQVFLNLRWAAQAYYFAWRVWSDVTAGGGHEFNRAGLSAARAVLAVGSRGGH